MADEVWYDYKAMDNAYEAMKRISSRIDGECEAMSGDALRLLTSNGGAYADGYQAKLTKLNTDIDELNSEMTGRASQMQKPVSCKTRRFSGRNTTPPPVAIT